MLNALLPGVGLGAIYRGCWPFVLVLVVMLGLLIMVPQYFLEARIGRDAPPPIGSWVTYRYNGTNPGGLPRFARFLRIRE